MATIDEKLNKSAMKRDFYGLKRTSPRLRGKNGLGALKSNYSGR